jgi:5-methylcytosine-specific restriction protein A
MGRLYDLAVWHRLREKQLSDEPLCRHCKAMGIVVLATDVDHIVPIAQGGAELDQANLQSLCHECHSRKTISENGGKPNTAIGIDGVPLDASHPWNAPRADNRALPGDGTRGGENYGDARRTPRW